MAAVALACALALAGCGLLSGLVHTQTDIENAGFANATVNYKTTGVFTTILVTADSNPALAARPGPQAEAVANVVWNNLPGYFNELSVTIHGVGTTTYPSDRLQTLFGPRPAALDGESLASEAAHDGVVAVVTAFGVVLVLVFVVFILVIMTRRKAKRARARRASLLMATIPEDLWAALGPDLPDLPVGGVAEPTAGPPPPGSPPTATPVDPPPPGWPPTAPTVPAPRPFPGLPSMPPPPPPVPGWPADQAAPPEAPGGATPETPPPSPAPAPVTPPAPAPPPVTPAWGMPPRPAPPVASTLATPPPPPPAPPPVPGWPPSPPPPPAPPEEDQPTP